MMSFLQCEVPDVDLQNCYSRHSVLNYQTRQENSLVSFRVFVGGRPIKDLV